MNSPSEEDRLSSLPDTVIQHILSFLPTKQAIATGILSSRWTSLWTSVPILSFDDDLPTCRSCTCSCNPSNHKRFMELVEEVLNRHTGSNVHNFSLSCHAPWNNLSPLKSVITTTTTKCNHLQHINLIVTNICHRNPLIISLGIFISLPILTTLKIDMKCTMKIPCLTNFTTLKVLHLVGVKLSSASSTQQVVFDFQTLQELLLKSFQMVNIETLTIRALKLETFTVVDHGCKNAPLNREIKVYAESLVFLFLTSALQFDYSLLNLSSLLKAYIDVYHTISRVPKLLRAISNVKDLTLTYSDEIYDALVLPQEDQALPPLTLPNVITVAINAEHAACLNFRDLMTLIDILPSVESLLLTIQELHLHEDESWIPTTIPKCLLSHLKFIKIGVFHGTEEGIHVFSYFLKNSRVLERMVIVFSERLRGSSKKKQAEVKKRLLLVPRASPYCVIDFEGRCI